MTLSQFSTMLVTVLLLALGFAAGRMTGDMPRMHILPLEESRD